MNQPSPPDVIESPRLLVRTLRPGDEARLQVVFDAAPDWHAALGRPADPDAAAREIAASADKAGREIAVITLREGGQDVGAIGWWRANPEPHVALLGTLVITPAYRRSGLAREALGAVEAWLAEGGTTEMRTAFARALLPLHPLVKALGFREMSIAEHQKLGFAGAGTSLWSRPLAAG
ncbi:GNAT family N-acetyltransferase [Longimicrobium sp.]|uniref:GNAT family N-acetyltransferase n=1 Tax=Longimicrobium sp. TaxID=2029185 RepID=UPI002C34B41A|nr:GNAT family N-acetyltransferase [Longimicrobium sp.]HSU17210.1 GNAT family N-acetyltransferase [Longimicrobium sp.]